MLKSLVCRCYTFYGCEFLLKFSAELSEIEPSHLVYKKSGRTKPVTILKFGVALVRCRHVNIVSRQLYEFS